MSRIQRHKWGGGGRTNFGIGSSHLLKIGWKNGNTPTRLRGFVLCADSFDNSNRPIIDFAAMKALGFEKKQIEKGIADGYKAADGLLPRTVPVLILWDAVRDEDGNWKYAGSYSEELLSYNEKGLFCEGDGKRARRRMTDGTKREIPCIPAGSNDDPKSWCPISVEGKCKAHGRCALAVLAPNPNAPENLPAWRRMTRIGPPNAVFRIDSSSPPSLAAILEELDRAATACEGFISGLVGSLSVNYKQRRKPEGGSVVAPILHLAISEEQIKARQAEILDRRLRFAEIRRLEIAPPDAVKALAPPEREPEQTADEIVHSEPPADGADDNCFVEPEPEAPAGDPDDIATWSDEAVSAALKAYLKIVGDARGGGKTSAVLRSIVDELWPAEGVALADVGKDRARLIAATTRARELAEAAADAVAVEEGAAL